METTPVKHGGRYKLKYRGTECLNCGHPLELSDRYCPYCSQANSTKHLSLRDFLDELFEDMVRFDTRLVRTLQTMLWRPGRVSREYIEGRRKTYANPFRLLLSLGIIYFLLLNLSSDFERLDRDQGNISEPIDLLPNLGLKLDTDNKDFKEAMASLDSSQLKKLDSLGIKGLDNLNMEKLDSLDLTGLEKLNLKERLKERNRRIDSMIMSNPRIYLDSIRGDGWINRTFKKATFFYTLINKDSVYTYEEVTEKHGLPTSTEDQIAFGIADSLDHLKRQPGSFLKEFISTVPFAIFVFLPFFTVFLRLVYIRKKYTYTDNLVFSFYSQSLFFILLIVSYLIDAIFGIVSIGWFILIFAIYLYLSMRRFYRQGWFKTTIKYLFLNTVFIILASVAALFFLIGSALTF